MLCFRRMRLSDLSHEWWFSATGGALCKAQRIFVPQPPSRRLRSSAVEFLTRRLGTASMSLVYANLKRAIEPCTHKPRTGVKKVSSVNLGPNGFCLLRVNRGNLGPAHEDLAGPSGRIRSLSYPVEPPKTNGQCRAKGSSCLDICLMVAVQHPEDE